MSTTMLEQAIIDASALREAAQRTAEQQIVNKYKEEIKEAVANILEQDEEESMPDDDMLGDLGDLGGEDSMASGSDPTASQMPLAATDVESGYGEQEEIEIDFNQLVAALDSDEEGDQMNVMDDEPTDLPPLQEQEENVTIPPQLGTELHKFHMGKGDPVYEIGNKAFTGEPVSISMLEQAIESLSGRKNTIEDQEGLSELLFELEKLVPTSSDSIEELNGQKEGETVYESDVNEDIIKSIAEALEVDYENVPTGWGLGRNKRDVEEAEEAALAASQDDKNKEDIERFKKALESLTELKEINQLLLKKNKELELQTNKFKQSGLEVANQLKEANLVNAKLLYKCKVLENNSLNERQKSKLVETISKVTTVEEAEFAYKTLQQSLGKVSDTAKAKKPMSLNESLNGALTAKTRNSVFSAIRNKENKPNKNPSEEKSFQRWKHLAGLTK